MFTTCSSGSILGLEVQHILSSEALPILIYYRFYFLFSFFTISLYLITSEHFFLCSTFPIHLFFAQKCLCSFFIISSIPFDFSPHPTLFLFFSLDSHHCIKYQSTYWTFPPSLYFAHPAVFILSSLPFPPFPRCFIRFAGQGSLCLYDLSPLCFLWSFYFFSLSISPMRCSIFSIFLVQLHGPSFTIMMLFLFSWCTCWLLLCIPQAYPINPSICRPCIHVLA